MIIRSHLKGKISQHKHIMGEAVYNKLQSDIRIRKEEGLVFDHNILDIDEREVQMKYV